MLHRRSHHVRVVILVLLAGVSAASAAQAWPGPHGLRALLLSLREAGFPHPSGRAAQRVALGPDGELVSPLDSGPVLLDGFLIHALRQDSEGLVEVHHPDGSVSIDLEGRYQSASVATIGTNGAVVACASGHAGVTRCLHAHPDSITTRVER